MSAARTKNLAASILQRLLNHAQRAGEEFQVTLNNFLLERFLYRLGRSPAKTRFVLKGAHLFRVWADIPYRATLDLDLLRRGASNQQAIATDIRAICSVSAPEDAIEFDTSDLTVEEIRAEDEYSGVRVRCTGLLGNTRTRLQIDIGTADATWPDPEMTSYPTLLALPAPTVLAYHPATVVAEKLEALVVLGLTNSRIKDYFDLQHMAANFQFDGETLVRAINATFERRKTLFPEAVPEGLTDAYWEYQGREAHLRAFARRARVSADVPKARALLPLLRQFLLSPIAAARARQSFGMDWKPGGPWRKKQKIR
ncbi:MAG: nucleotidyl transferase AbiEii/AbiGii toxin family protein [Burkholderiales bacterium]